MLSALQKLSKEKVVEEIKELAMLSG